MGGVYSGKQSYVKHTTFLFLIFYFTFPNHKKHNNNQSIRTAKTKQTISQNIRACALFHNNTLASMYKYDKIINQNRLIMFFLAMCIKWLMKLLSPNVIFLHDLI